MAYIAQCRGKWGIWILKDKVTSFFASNCNFYIILFLAMLIRSFPFGFAYFAFADDHNAYGIYSLVHENRWQNVVMEYNLFFTFRPLAGLLDAALSRFWGNMEFVLLAITGLQFATIYLFDKLFRASGLLWTRLMAVFFVFFPASSESAYWLLASTRIVTSGFLSVLSAFFMRKFLYQEGRYKLWLAISLLSGILAQGFYEQGIIFAFVVTFGLLLLHRNVIRRKILYLWPFVNLAIIGTHYYMFRDAGTLTTRAGFVDEGLFSRVPVIVGRISHTFLWEQGRTVSRTLDWGISYLFSEHLFLTVIVALFALLLAIFIVYDNTQIANFGKSAAVSAIAGVVLTIAPLTIFFFLAESWIWVRNLYYTVLGVAILVGIGARLLTRPIGTRGGVYLRAVKIVFAFSVTALFFTGFILEVDSLRKVERYDTVIVESMIEELDRLGVSENEKVWLFGTRWNYTRKINPRITSQARVDWALNGHFGAASGTLGHQRPRVIPIMCNGGTREVSMWNITLNLEYDTLLGLDEQLNVRELRFDEQYLIFADTSVVFGILDENGIFSKK